MSTTTRAETTFLPSRHALPAWWRAPLALIAITMAAVVFSGTKASDGLALSQMLDGVHIGEVATTEYVSQLPLSFIPNQGQTDRSVRFHVQGPGHTIFFTDDEVVFSAAREVTLGETATDVVRMGFVGSNPSPTLEAMDSLSGVVNFYIGTQPSG